MDWITVVCGIAVQNGKVFAARRAAHKSNPGLWEFPGGKVEAVEDMSAALKREIMEEFDCRVECGTEFAFVRTGRLSLHALHMRFLDDPVQSTDHDKLGWMSLSELSDLRMTAPDIPIRDKLTGKGKPESA